MAVGGVDSKIYILGINPEAKRKEKTSQVKEICELISHTGPVQACRFLNSDFVISSSEDSTIMLWNINNPERYLVKYNDH